MPPFPEDEDEQAQQQEDLVNKLMNQNPDMMDPMQQIGAAQQQEDQKLKQLEGHDTSNQLLVKPNTKTRNPGQILTRLKRQGQIR